ncbi:hypothetical protein CS542_06475 [Pedobacter sp. IW39]|nr:hypothetical protein CS542_06475 [Pedobacter sp. IW39]
MIRGIKYFSKKSNSAKSRFAVFLTGYPTFNILKFVLYAFMILIFHIYQALAPAFQGYRWYFGYSFHWVLQALLYCVQAW